MKRESSHRSLRLWPGVTAAILLLVAWLVVPRAVPMTEAQMGSVFGAFFFSLVIFVWWAFFSRASRLERWGGILLLIAAMAVTKSFLLHESVATGNLGVQYFMFSVPTTSLALVVFALLRGRLGGTTRRLALVAAVVIGCGAWALVRSHGVTGEGIARFGWRWAATPEERMLSQQATDPATPVAPELAADAAIRWPGYRGAGRDSSLRGVRIETDWVATPPIELWRRSIGPGVSSFAVQGGYLYTQEQRGDDEVVSSYELETGAPVWRHRDPTRFEDPHVGAGPRATPALSGGRVYTFGATGLLNALDARDGVVVWSLDAAADTGSKVPLWGFTNSPLIVGDVVVVHTNALAAYDLATGERRWLGPETGGSYSSPHLVSLGGVEQIFVLGHRGAFGFAVADGSLLWEHLWEGIGIMQPLVTADGGLVYSLVNGGALPVGTRRIEVVHGADGWSAEERWTSSRLKPAFSDSVVHKGHAFGFDGKIMASIDLDNGERNWKGGRYGAGQVLLLEDQDLLLVLSEAGELALVEARPDGFAELASHPALEGRTWNEPVLVGDLLVVRNGEEMAAFRLPLASSDRAAPL